MLPSWPASLRLSAASSSGQERQADPYATGGVSTTAALNEHYRQKGEVDMLLKDLDTYLKERGVVSLHLSAEDGKYTCVARTAHGRSVSASGLGSVDAVVGRVLWSLSQAESGAP